MTVMRDIPDKICQIQFIDNIWTDVTPWLQPDITVNRGSNRVETPIIRYDPGKCTVKLDNTDRRFDPTNNFGPYWDPSLGNRILPMRPIRVLMEWQNVRYPLFRGYIDEWDIAWNKNITSSVTVSATDGFKIFQNKRRVPLTTAVGAGELISARVNRILDSVSWPNTAEFRNIATSNSVCQGTLLDGSALEELQRAADSEIGEFYMAADGRATFRGRRALFTDTRSNTAQGNYGIFQGITNPCDVEFSTDDTTLWNEVIAQIVGGNPQTSSDATSIATYSGMSKTLSVDELILTDDVTADNYADFILYLSKDAEIRYVTLSVHPMADPDIYFNQVLNREIGDRITISFQPSGGGLPITRDVFIRGISHTIRQRDWLTTWVLQSASKYSASFLILGDSVLGKLNSGNIWGY